MWLFLKRIFKFAWQDFHRKKGLTVQAIFIMSVIVFFISSIFFIRGVGFAVIRALEQKVDVAVYFKENTIENDILTYRTQILAMERVEEAQYISNTDALANFLQKHQNDKLYLTALAEIEENPFLSSIDIKAKNPADYSFIVSDIEQSSFNQSIDRITYNENKTVIERLHALTSSLQKAAFIIAFIFCLLVILILFNTVRLTIISQKSEITTSRLAGASNWFVRGPFFAQTVFYSVAAVVLVDIVIFTATWFLNDVMSNWFLNFYLFDYFKQNMLWLLAIQLGAALVLGFVASALAVRKYLKI